MRIGARYLEALKDARCIYVHGEQVEDVTVHPAFCGISQTVASLYDLAADPESGMTFTSPETGRIANKVYMIPRSQADLKDRREAITRWAKVTNGLLGRGPDHVGGFLAGFASYPQFFGDFADHVTRFYNRVVEESLFITYVIIPPQIDRSKTAQGQEEAFLQVGVCAEKDDGIVTRGAQMLGTGTAVSDYLFVSCIVPLKPGDEDYALSLVLPVSTPGLKLYCRPPYAPDKPSTFDYPLSTRFDETDVLAVFDDVFIPWEQIFIYRDVEKLRAQFFETPAHVLGNTQAQIRLVAKLKFILGLARKVSAVNRIDEFPAVQEKLGELATLAATVEGLVVAAEATCQIDQNGVARPNPRFLYGSMGQQADLYPRAIQILRELAGGGVIQVPASYKDLTSVETGDTIRRYIRSPGVPSEERIKLFKLVWDIVGTEFGGRHQQYEMFYAGAPYVAKSYAYRNYGYEEALAQVEEYLSTYGLEEDA